MEPLDWFLKGCNEHKGYHFMALVLLPKSM
jgi:hypothetical protein